MFQDRYIRLAWDLDLDLDLDREVEFNKYIMGGDIRSFWCLLWLSCQWVIEWVRRCKIDSVSVQWIELYLVPLRQTY